MAVTYDSSVTLDDATSVAVLLVRIPARHPTYLALYISANVQTKHI